MAERKLSLKQRLFVESYLANPNATEAARQAGYKGNDVTLAAVGAENLRKPRIAALVEKRVEEAAMPANEVLRRLTEHARASLADVLDESGEFDLDLARRQGTDRLLKKLKVRHDKEGNVTYEYEIHDPQAALVHLGRYHKLFTDKTENEHTGKDGGPIETIIFKKADASKYDGGDTDTDN